MKRIGHLDYVNGGTVAVRLHSSGAVQCHWTVGRASKDYRPVAQYTAT